MADSPLEPDSTQNGNVSKATAVAQLVASMRMVLKDYPILRDQLIKFLLGKPGVSEEWLRQFLNAIRFELGLAGYESVEFLPTEIDSEFFDEKIISFDILVRDAEGNRSNVEIQLWPHPSFIQRTIYYGARLHGSQLVKGDKYNQLRQTCCFILTTFDPFPSVEPDIDATSKNQASPPIIRDFWLTMSKDCQIRLDDLGFIFIYIPQFMDTSRINLSQKLIDWLCFLHYPNISDQELQEVFMRNPEIVEAATAAVDYAKGMPGFFYDKQKRMRDWEIWNQQQFQLGEKSGEARGEARGKAGTVIRQLQRVFRDSVTPELEDKIRSKANFDFENPESAQSTLEYLDNLLDYVYEAKTIEQFAERL